MIGNFNSSRADRHRNQKYRKMIGKRSSKDGDRLLTGFAYAELDAARSVPSMLNPAIQHKTLIIAACLALATGLQTEAKDPDIPLQGLFCNTLEQIDETLAHIDRGLTPRTAVELLNRHEIVCNYVYRLYYVVNHPIKVEAHRGRMSAVKYEAVLTGVIVGGLLRPVFPSTRIFFITPEPLAEILLEKRS